MSRIAILLIFILFMAAYFLPPEKEILQISQEQTIANKLLVDTVVMVSQKNISFFEIDQDKSDLPTFHGCIPSG